LYLKDFTYHKPRTLKEACIILEQCSNGALIAGGTDVLVEFKKGLRNNDNIVSLSNLDELKLIYETEQTLIIGSCVTHNEVIKSPLIKNLFPALSEAASKIGTEQIRNTGTIGGNLCTGASCCDMAPIVIALNAKVEVTGSANIRLVSLKDFFLSHKETALKKGEIMTNIIIPLPQKGFGASFEKFGLREAASISVASVSISIYSDGNVCTDACVVTGAVAPTPRISQNTIEILVGKNVDELIESSLVLKSVGEAAVKDALPIDDLRGSAEYRRYLVNSLTQRALKKAVIRSIDSFK
jgi:CO/xanthine dehydrogenase FAD-binding subunit